MSMNFLMSFDVFIILKRLLGTKSITNMNTFGVLNKNLQIGDLGEDWLASDRPLGPIGRHAFFPSVSNFLNC